MDGRRSGLASEVPGGFRRTRRDFRCAGEHGTPGAREAGIIWFLDRSFGSIMQDRLAFARGGLAAFQAGVPSASPGAKTFSDLEPADQDAYLRTQENTGFFGFMRFMTLAGFFAMSCCGGNRDNVGWKLLGLEHASHAWQLPFGYYDAEYMSEVVDD